MFNTEEVIIEYRDGDKRVAPFVSPRKNGINVLRRGYNVKSYAPANIAPRRSLSVDDLKRKGFGEALFSNLTPAQREIALTMMDYQDLDKMISRREELMASELLQNNALTMKHYADKGDEYEEKYIQFYDGDKNPNVYTPAVKWDDAKASIIDDVHAMIKMIVKGGMPATEVLMGEEVANAFINNETIQKLLDNRRYQLGNVNPVQLPSMCSRIATLNIYGRNIDFITYENTYTDDDGNDVPYIPANKIILTAPACGHTSYGCVTQVEQSDGDFHSYAGRRVPKYVADAYGNTRSLTITSRPLMIPTAKMAWVAADVL